MPKPIRGNRDLIRAINRSAVLNTVKTFGPVSRVQVARRTGLSAATISAITNDLITSNLIFEKEEGDSSGGRRPILLALNPKGGFVIGIKLTEDHLSAALTDLEATLLASLTIPLTGSQLETILDSIGQLVYVLLKEQQIPQHQFLGVGIGLAGIVDASRGLLCQSPIFGWKNVPIADRLRERLGVPIYIDNDVNTLTMTELWFGRGQGVDHFLTATVGRGVGLGIVIDGKLYQGYSGGAGELGHIVIDPEGAECACGKRGCLETFVAEPHLIRLANQEYTRLGMSVEVKDIMELLECVSQGDLVARGVLVRAGEIFGESLANLINILVPQLIIISGEGVRAGELFFDPMRQSIARHVLPGLVEKYTLEIDIWDEYAWARGAAGLVLHQLFESPIQGQMLRQP